MATEPRNTGFGLSALGAACLPAHALHRLALAGPLPLRKVRSIGHRPVIPPAP